MCLNFHPRELKHSGIVSGGLRVGDMEVRMRRKAPTLPCEAERASLGTQGPMTPAPPAVSSEAT